MIKKIVLALITLLLAASFAASSDYLKFNLQKSPGVRAAGFGGAFCAIADDNSAFFYNPAGLPQIKRPNITLSYDSFYRGFFSGITLSYSQAFMQTMAGGASIVKAMPSGAGFTGDSYYFSYATYLENTKALSLGFNLKFISVYSADINVSGGSAGADLGLLFVPNVLDKKMRFAFLLQDIDGWVSWSNKTKTKIPFMFKAGTAYYIDKTWPVVFDVDITHFGEGTGYDRRALHLGSEKWFLDPGIGNFAFRTGAVWKEASENPFTLAAGLSYSRENFNLHYVYMPDFSGIGDAHKFSATYFFNEIIEEFKQDKPPVQEAKATPVPEETAVAVTFTVAAEDAAIFSQALRALALDISRKYFSPENRLSGKVDLKISGVPSGMQGIFWKIDILDSKSESIMSYSGEGIPPSIVAWNGAQKDGRLAADGDYFVRLKIFAGQTEVASKTKIVSVDRQDPIFAIKLSSQVLAPSEANKNTVSISVITKYKDIKQWEAAITDAKGNPVKTVVGEGVPEKFSWDGRNIGGKTVKNGEYKINISAEDFAGNTYDAGENISVDTTVTNFSVEVERSIFEREKEAAGLTVKFSQPDKIKKWEAAVLDMEGNIVLKVEDLKPENTKFSWKGTDQEGNPVRDGTAFKYRLRAIQKNEIVVEKTGYLETALPKFNEFGMRLTLAAIDFPQQDKFIKIEDYAQLNQAGEAINKYAKNYYVFIKGFATDYGDPEKDLELSIMRVKAAKEYLVESQKIPAENIFAVGYGDGEFADENIRQEAAKKGMRVEVELLTK